LRGLGRWGGVWRERRRVWGFGMLRFGFRGEGMGELMRLGSDGCLVVRSNQQLIGRAGPGGRPAPDRSTRNVRRNVPPDLAPRPQRPRAAPADPRRSTAVLLAGLAPCTAPPAGARRHRCPRHMPPPRRLRPARQPRRWFEVCLDPFLVQLSAVVTQLFVPEHQPCSRSEFDAKLER
jgi:hypothetical protein